VSWSAEIPRMHPRFQFRSAIGLVAALTAPNFTAAAPTVTLLVPSGGQRGTTVDVLATGTFAKWPVQVWSSEKSLTAAALPDKGKFRITIAKDATPGVSWLRWHDDTGASTLRPFVVGTLPEVAEVEPNDEVAKAQPIAGSAVVNGKLAKPGDVDCFAVKLTKGQTLVADLVAHEVLRSPMDAVLQIVDPKGNVLEQNNDCCGLDPRIAFKAPRDGTYTVRLFAFPSQPDSSVRFFGSDACIYRLTLSTAEFVDFVAPLAVEGKGTAKVTLHGWNLATTTRDLPPGEERFGIVSGTAWRVRREPHPCFDLTKAQPDAPLSIPFTATGLIGKPGAVNRIPFAATKGKPLGLQIESPSMNLALTPVLRILESGGKQLAHAEPAAPNVDVETTFTPPADGTYRIEVRDLNSDGGPRHAYRLRVAPMTPDFDLSVSSDRFIASLDRPLDIAVAVNRRNGFSGDIELSVEGLPADVTATQVTASDKSNAKSLTLRLTAKKGGLNVPIHIVGKSKGDPATRHEASAAVAGFDTTSPDLWLTVSGKAAK
jgi:hypothetical protein